MTFLYAKYIYANMLQLNGIRRIVSEMAGSGVEEVRVVVSPYRICPLGAHIDHQVGFRTFVSVDWLYFTIAFFWMLSLLLTSTPLTSLHFNVYLASVYRAGLLQL